MTLPPVAVITSLLAVTLVAGIYDARSRRIPNWLTGAGVLVGSIANTVYSGWSGLSLSIRGLGLSFAVMCVLYAVRAMGAGDVKLHGAIGATVGWQNWLGILVATSIVSAVMAVILVARKRRFAKTMWNIAFIIAQLKSGRPAYLRDEELDVRHPNALTLPHGSAVAVGTMFFLAAAAHV